MMVFTVAFSRRLLLNWRKASSVVERADDGMLELRIQWCSSACVCTSWMDDVGQDKIT